MLKFNFETLILGIGFLGLCCHGMNYVRCREIFEEQMAEAGVKPADGPDKTPSWIYIQQAEYDDHNPMVTLGFIFNKPKTCSEAGGYYVRQEAETLKDPERKKCVLLNYLFIHDVPKDAVWYQRFNIDERCLEPYNFIVQQRSEAEGSGRDAFEWVLFAKHNGALLPRYISAPIEPRRKDWVYPELNWNSTRTEGYKETCITATAFRENPSWMKPADGPEKTPSWIYIQPSYNPEPQETDVVGSYVRQEAGTLQKYVGQAPRLRWSDVLTNAVWYRNVNLDGYLEQFIVQQRRCSGEFEWVLFAKAKLYGKLMFLPLYTSDPIERNPEFGETHYYRNYIYQDLSWKGLENFTKMDIKATIENPKGQQ